jgi:hypothetical protein
MSIWYQIACPVRLTLGRGVETGQLIQLFVADLAIDSHFVTKFEAVDEPQDCEISSSEESRRSTRHRLHQP